jgi:hypothetical protein
VSEWLFQMRLLWSEWLTQSSIPRVAVPCFQRTQALADDIILRLRRVFSQHVDARGMERFQRDILARLRRREIGLLWFRRQLSNERNAGPELLPLSAPAWDVFLRDGEGRSCSAERVFQMQLTLANLYREARASKTEVTTWTAKTTRD